MNTKTEQISSGLVAVAWMMQSPDDQCMGFLPFEEEGTTPVVRLSDAEAIIDDLQNLVIAENQRKQQLEQEVAAKDAEIGRLHQFEVAFTEWLEKSDWVQEDKDGLFYGWALGLHRADAMRKLIKQQAERINELEASVKYARMDAETWMRDAEGKLADRTKAYQTITKQAAALKLAMEAIGEVQDLIGESHGVYGLHLNGDESPWGELEQGGRFERLTSLNKALAAIDSLQGE